MWSAILSTCVCTATAQFTPFGFGHFGASGQQNFDAYGSYGTPEFSQFQGVSNNGRDFNVNSLTGYGVPPSVNYDGQGFAGQAFGQYGSQGYPGDGSFPQGVNQNHLQQSMPSGGHGVQQENNIQPGGPHGQTFPPRSQGQGPVIGQPGQSVLTPGHQQNVPLPNHISANQADGRGHPPSHHASQQLLPQHEQHQQIPHHHHQHQHHQQQRLQEPHQPHQTPGLHGEAQLGSGHVPSSHNQHPGGHVGIPDNQFDVNYNGVSHYPEQYQGQQLGLQVPQQYQQQTQQHHGEKSASSPSAASAPLDSAGFKGIPLEAFAQQDFGQRLQQNTPDQPHTQNSAEAPPQRPPGDHTEESSKKEVIKSS